MIRVIFVIFILFGSVKITHSQSLEIGVWSGMGTYDLNTLRVIESQSFKQNTIPRLQTPDSKTIHSNYGVIVQKVYSNFSVGSFFRYEFSGNQKAYYNLTQKKYYEKSGTNLVYGISGRFHLKKQEFKNIKYYPYYSLKLGRASSTFDYSNNPEDGTTGQKFNLSSNSLIIEPGIGIRAYNGFIKIDPAVSLYIPFHQSHFKINNENELVNPSDENKETTNLFGLRIGVTLSVPII